VHTRRHGRVTYSLGRPVSLILPQNRIVAILPLNQEQLP